MRRLWVSARAWRYRLLGIERQAATQMARRDLEFRR